MFIVPLYGGLGNQMYQYVFAKALEKYYAIPVYIDLSHYDYGRTNHNGYELNRVFGIRVKKLKDRKYMKMKRGLSGFIKNYGEPERHTANKKRQALINIGQLKNVGEMFGYNEFNDNVFKQKVSDNVYFDGYFQNTKYFDILSKREIYNLFTFKPIQKENKNVAEMIKNSNSVSIHIRRGDYARSCFDILDVDYYKNAINFISGREKSLEFFVFTDDPQYAEKALGFLSNKHISNNHGANSYVDMQLMSMCRHNILANSSFSFWGGFLNQNDSKIVVCPKYLQIGCKFISDKGWIKIGSY